MSQLTGKIKYRCVIVDDEPIAIRIIRSYLEKLEDFEVVGSYTNAIEALAVLSQQAIDLLFLDIQMPGITGLSLIKSLRQRPRVILTTAFREYAVDAFDLDLLDYLLKPISFERFLKAINKFLDTQTILPQQGISSSEHEFIVVKSDKKSHKIKLSEILYIESLDDYIRIHMVQKSLVCYSRLTSIEQQINDVRFIRIHRSFLINSVHVTAYTSFQVEINGKKIPIGRKYRDSLQKMSGNYL